MIPVIYEPRPGDEERRQAVHEELEALVWLWPLLWIWWCTEPWQA